MGACSIALVSSGQAPVSPVWKMKWSVPGWSKGSMRCKKGGRSAPSSSLLCSAALTPHAIPLPFTFSSSLQSAALTIVPGPDLGIVLLHPLQCCHDYVVKRIAHTAAGTDAESAPNGYVKEVGLEGVFSAHLGATERNINAIKARSQPELNTAR